MLLATMAASPAAAQENGRDYEPYPYTFVGVQGGGQVTFTNNSFSKLATPIGAVSVGRFFTPAVGARLNVQGFQNKAGYKIAGADRTFDFKYATTDLDLMLNLSNIFCPKKVHPLNLILVGGVGLSYAWDNDDQAALIKEGGLTESMAWSDNRLVHNFRIGLQLEANVAKHWGINLEVAANNLHDRFNSKTNGNADWQATAMLGVTYKFGFHKRQQSDVSGALAQQDYDNSRNNAIAVATPPVAQDKPVEPVVFGTPEKEKMRVEVFFDINSASIKPSEVDKVRELAAMLKRHPEVKVYLTGYADAGTGTTDINRDLSEKRVQSVAKLLQERHGIPASRIVTDFKGDTVQPFSDNDSNRVTVGIAEEQ